MSERTELQFLQDIAESAEAAQQYLQGMTFEEFLQDRKTRAATIRELEIIGEAASNISAEKKQRYGDVPWRLLKDFRNVLAHEYFGVSNEIVWDVVQTKLPGVIISVKRIVAVELSAHNPSEE